MNTIPSVNSVTSLPPPAPRKNRPTRMVCSLAAAGLIAFLLAGCATARQEDPAAAFARFRAETYSLYPEGNIADAPALATVRLETYRVNGKDVIIHPTSLVAGEIRSAITNLFGLLRDSGVFQAADSGSVPEFISAHYDMHVKFDADENTHAGQAGLKAGLVGGLTLGLFGHNLANNYDYHCDVQLTVIRADGTERKYHAESEVSARWRASEGSVPSSAARVQAATESFRSIVGQMQQDASFYDSQP